MFLGKKIPRKEAKIGFVIKKMCTAIKEKSYNDTWEENKKGVWEKSHPATRKNITGEQKS